MQISSYTQMSQSNLSNTIDLEKKKLLFHNQIKQLEEKGDDSNEIQKQLQILQSKIQAVDVQIQQKQNQFKNGSNYQQIIAEPMNAVKSSSTQLIGKKIDVEV
jgi:tetrahydromethanopterin S-methyltransferase subunit G